MVAVVEEVQVEVEVQVVVIVLYWYYVVVMIVVVLLLLVVELLLGDHTIGGAANTQHGNIYNIYIYIIYIIIKGSSIEKLPIYEQDRRVKEQ